MALLTYADLTAAVANWLNRTGLDARIQELVDLADARIRREQEWDRRVYSNENGGVGFTVISQGGELPAGVLSVRSLWPTTGSSLRPLTQTTFDELRDLANTNQNATGVPKFYAILPARDPATAGPRLYLWPPSTPTVDFLYIKDVGKLSTGVNDLYKFAPDLYLFGALAESAPFLKHDERVPMWEAKYASIMAALNAQAERAQYGAGRLRARFSRAFS